MSEIELPPFPLSGFEVYETVSSNDKKDKKDKKTDKKDKKSTDNNSSTNSTSDDSDKKDISTFIAHNGEIKEIAYFDNMYDNSFDEDYEGISNNGSVSFSKINRKRFFKGKKICLKKANDTGKPLKWKDLESCLLGFISDITVTTDGFNLKLVGMTKLLDQEKKFNFKQTKRSKILKEMIEAAGLKAKIDVTGLKDDVIDYTNISSSGSSSGLAGGQGGDIDELVAGWCQGKTSDLEKAKAIHYGLREYGIRYRKYYDTEYHTAQNCLKHARDPGINCGDCAILTTACMKSGGLNAYIAMRCDSLHYFTVINIDGTNYFSDLTWSEGNLSQREWNDTWDHDKCIGSNKGSSLDD